MEYLKVVLPICVFALPRYRALFLYDLFSTLVYDLLSSLVERSRCLNRYNAKPLPLRSFEPYDALRMSACVGCVVLYRVRLMRASARV